MLKFKLKFGIRGGIASQEYILNKKSQAEALARDIANILLATVDKDWNGLNEPRYSEEVFKMHSNCPKKSWTSSTHFVIFEKVD